MYRVASATGATRKVTRSRLTFRVTVIGCATLGATTKGFPGRLSRRSYPKKTTRKAGEIAGNLMFLGRSATLKTRVCGVRNYYLCFFLWGGKRGR